ncbi:mitochondrial tRNA-specific 2-thiouridylase 1 [Ciona intestinalis]
MSKVICAISGGVDSAVAALLLKRRGLNVVGVFMRNWDLEDEVGQCSVQEDANYATRVCRALDIPFYEVNLVKEYWTNVFMPMVDQYEMGNTPNPDILCNQFVKFSAFHKKCSSLFGNVVIATGHYAKTTLNDRVLTATIPHTAEQRLLKAVDPFKDQTFFLHKVDRTALLRSYFPLGGIFKSKVKEIAADSEISFVLKRKESAGICFIGRREFSNFIKNYISPKPGQFICYETGNAIGNHDGYFSYTVGQRSLIGGLHISYAVLHRNSMDGNVFVVPGLNHPALYRKSLVSGPAHWIAGKPALLREGKPLNCYFRFCHRNSLVPCTVHQLENERLLIILQHPLRAMTVGQDAVLYTEDECLGGARIDDVGPSMYESQSQDKIVFDTFRNNCDLWLRMLDTYGPQVAAFSSADTTQQLNDYNKEINSFKHSQFLQDHS